MRRFAGIALLVAWAVAAMAADPAERATAIIEKARTAISRGRAQAVDALVAADRFGTFEAVDRLLRESRPADVPVARALAEAYERSFRDDSVRRRVATHEGWSPSERSRWLEGLRDKDAAKSAFADGRFDAAQAAFERLQSVFRGLGDACEEARCLTSLGAIAASRGESRRALEQLDAARSAAARAGDEDLVGAIELNRAYALDDLGQDDDALRALDAAQAAADRAGDGEVALRVGINRGSILQKLGRSREAAAAFRTAADAAARAGDLETEANAWFNIAVVGEAEGDLPGQLEAWNRSLKVARKAGLSPLEARILIALAEVERKRARWPAARDHLDAARRLVAGVDDPQLLAELELAEGQHRIARGRYSEALPFLDAAAGQLEGLDALALSNTVQGTRAVALYYSGEYSLAEAALRRALAEAQAAGRIESEAERRAGLGFVLFQLGDAAAGLAEIERAAGIHETLGETARRAYDLELLGVLRFRAGDLVGARAALEEALRGLDRDRDATRYADTLKDLAEVDLARGGQHRAAARRSLGEAERIAASQGDPFGVLQASLLGADAAIEDGELQEARAALGRADEAARRTSTREFAWQAQLVRGRLAEAAGDRASAVKAYRRAIREVERSREGATRVVGRAAILEDRIEPYRDLARLLRESGEIAASWRVARAGKARTFVERLRPPALDVDIVGTGEIVPAVSTYAPASPAGGFEPIAADRLLPLLRRGEVLLDLYLEGSELSVFVARREGLVARAFRLDAAAMDHLAAARWAGRPSAEDAPVTAAWRLAVRELGAAIVGPLEPDLSGAKALLIVPSGALHGLPFAALETGGKRLYERFDITLLPAADALVSRTRPGRGAGLLAFGDPAAGAGVTRLPAAADEARAIASMVPRGQAVVGDAATEALFRRRAPGAERIHVAAHGRVDRLAPARSHLLLAPGEGQDGRLEAAEIADLRLEASLVVLSGCATAVETGLARGDAPADDLFGLPRAFLAAGAGHVVAGLWEMDDEAGRAIMPRLYQELGSRDLSAAVAALQREIASAGPDDVLRGLDHPYYWAGIVVYGAGLEERPPSRSRSSR